MNAYVRTNIFTLKMESISDDLPECVCYGTGLIRPGTHLTTAGTYTYLSNDEDPKSVKDCIKQRS